ncbi:hypothetical protein, partial [Microbispora rosea]
MPPRRPTDRARKRIAQTCASLLAFTGLTVLTPAAPAQAHAAPIDAADYQRVELARGAAEMGEPMTMTVLPDLSAGGRRSRRRAGA